MWSCLGQKSEHSNSSLTLITLTDGAVPSISSVSAASTSSGKAVKHPFFFSLYVPSCFETVSACQLISADAFLDQVCHYIGYNITLRRCSPVPMITAEFVSSFYIQKIARSRT